MIVIVESGPSASGKTTFQRELEKKGVKVVKSYKTREGRNVSEPEYIHVSEEDFFKKERLNTITINKNWHYGVEKEQFEKAKDNDIFVYSVIDSEYAVEMIESLNNMGIFPEIITIDFNIKKDIRIKLLKERGESDSNIEKRLEREMKSKKIEESSSGKYKTDFTVRNFNESWDQAFKVIYQKTETKTVTFVGSSGSGKTCLALNVAGYSDYLGSLYDVPELNNDFYFVVSCTTRKKRVGEIDNLDYYFLTKEEFEKREYLELVNFAGNDYGVPIDEIKIGKINLVVAEPHGAAMIKEWSDKNFILNYIVYFDISEEMRMLQMINDPKRDSKTIKDRIKQDDIAEKWRSSGLKADLVFMRTNNQMKQKLLDFLEYKK